MVRTTDHTSRLPQQEAPPFIHLTEKTVGRRIVQGPPAWGQAGRGCSADWGKDAYEIQEHCFEFAESLSYKNEEQSAIRQGAYKHGLPAELVRRGFAIELWDRLLQLVANGRSGLSSGPDRIVAILMFPAHVAATGDIVSKTLCLFQGGDPRRTYYSEPLDSSSFEVPDGFEGFAIVRTVAVESRLALQIDHIDTADEG